MERKNKRDVWVEHLDGVRNPEVLFSGSAGQGLLQLLTLDGSVPYQSAAAGLTIHERALLQHVLGRREFTLEPPGGPGGPGDGAEGCDVLVAFSPLGKLTLHVTEDDPPDPADVVAGLRLPRWLLEMAEEETAAEQALEDREQAGLDAMLADWRGDGTLGDHLEEVIDWVERVETVFLWIGRRVFSRSDSGSSTLIRGNALPALRDRDLPEWTWEERLLVAGLHLLFRSGGPIRFEEFNGRQLTARALRTTLLRRICVYGRHARPGAAAALSADIATLPLERLATLAGELAADADSGPGIRYRRVNGLTYAKQEFIAPWDPEDRRVQDIPPVLAALAARRLGDTEPAAANVQDLVRTVTARAVEAAVLDGRATDLEEVVEAIVLGATLATGGDYAMSSGIRDLSQLEGGDIEPVLDLKKGDFFCCVLPTPRIAEDLAGDRLSEILWMVAQRMMYNRWHFMPGNYSRGAIPRKRHYFFSPILPDIGEWGGLRHGGHVHSQVRYTLRAPGAAMWMPPFAPYGHPYRGTFDIRVVRMEGPPFTVEDLRTACRYTHLIDVFWRQLTDSVRSGGLAAPQITAFDADWYRGERWREPLTLAAGTASPLTRKEVTIP